MNMEVFKETMKVFISQPMRGKREEEILDTRRGAILEINTMFPNENIEVIDSYIPCNPHSNKPIWCLGESLQLMSDAQFVYFCEGWKKARGCKIEHAVAVAYKIPHVEE